MGNTVFLVGAGPGAEMITAKGLSLIREAEVIIYDDLIDRRLLLEAGPKARLISAGKRGHGFATPQEDINGLMVRYACEGRRVVRLKGGDPLVFGRGGEEYLALEKAGIRAELVPGVTSAVAAGERMGLPVTHRGISSSFTVVTGHGAEATAEDMKQLAALKGTLVFMMALSKAETIAEGLMACGMPKDTPASIISAAYGRNEKRLDAALCDIGRLAKECQAPAVLIVGGTAKLRLRDEARGRLHGRHFLVTGTRSFVKKLCGLLCEEDASCDPYPCMDIEPDGSVVPEGFSKYGWLVFTSVNGVTIFFEELARRRTDIRALSGCRFACIGEATAGELFRHGIIADLVPSDYSSFALGNELVRMKKPGEKDRILLLRAAQASRELSSILEGSGFEVDERAIYSLVRPQYMLPAEEPDSYDGIIFGSAGGVDSFFDDPPWIVGEDSATVLPAAFCIGRYTALRWKERTGREAVCADNSTAEGIVRKIIETFS
jgi:uroporphyrinogen III methyltransferase/synthase